MGWEDGTRRLAFQDVVVDMKVERLWRASFAKMWPQVAKSDV
jgi:hypothetical protein